MLLLYIPRSVGFAYVTIARTPYLKPLVRISIASFNERRKAIVCRVFNFDFHGCSRKITFEQQFKMGFQ